MHRARKGSFVLLTAAMVVGSFGVSAGFAFADDCPAGTRPATAADIPLMTQAGIPNAVVGMCWNASDPNVGQTDAQAKQTLNTMWCGGRAASCGPYTSTVDGLDPKFATCAAKFLQAVRQRDPSICIVSAFRSTAHQAYLCGGGCGVVNGPCAAAGKSMHQQGLAIDIEKPGMNTLPAFVHQMAQQGGGVSFPVRNDDGHMQPAGGDCSTPGYVAPSGPSVPTTPIQSAMQGFQNLFVPPQPPQCPAGYVLLNGSCVPQQAMQSTQTSSPYNYLSPTPPPSSVTPVTTGTTGTTGTNTNTNTNSNSNPINLGNNTGSTISGLLGGNGDNGSSGGQSGSSTSAIDLINAIANPTTTQDATNPASTATGSPVTLTSSLNNTVALQGTPVGVSASSWQSSSTYSLSPTNSQTFVSQDMSQTPIQMQPMQPVNSTFAILEDLKQKLLYILAFLKPFGGVTPRATTVNNSTTAYME